MHEVIFGRHLVHYLVICILTHTTSCLALQISCLCTFTGCMLVLCMQNLSNWCELNGGNKIRTQISVDYGARAE